MESNESSYGCQCLVESTDSSRGSSCWTAGNAVPSSNAQRRQMQRPNESIRPPGRAVVELPGELWEILKSDK